MNITFNPAINEALDLMENTPQNLFITGKAGTGKSTLLTYFRYHTKKKIVVLAPTGWRQSMCRDKQFISSLG